jgi:hypothetical protein
MGRSSRSLCLDGHYLEEAQVIGRRHEQEPLDRDLCETSWRLVNLVTAFCLAPSLDQRGETNQQAEELYRDSWRLRRDLDAIFTDAVRSELVRVIQGIEANREIYRRSFLAWLDLIEDLCLDAERDLGPGTGPIKLRRVKAAMFHLLYRSVENVDLPGIPSYVEPLVLNLGIRWSIEFVITLVNSPDPDRSLWRYTSPQGALSIPQRWWLTRPDPWKRLVKRKDALAEWLVEAVVNWLLRPPKLSRSLQRKVDAIVHTWDEYATDGRPPIQQLAETAFAALEWVGTHGDQVRAAIDAISIVVHWTAEFADLTREQRIDLIKDTLIVYFEEDLGVSGPYFRFVLRLAIDFTVDSIFHLYRKRDAL